MILDVSNIDKIYDGFKLDNVSFNLKEGEIMGFVGTNGAGKTTTLKAIMNLINRDGGTIKIFDKDNIKDELAIKQDIGFVFDEVCFYQNKTVGKMLKELKIYYKSWNQQRCDELLKKFNLPKNKKIKELSKGMKMKFSLLVALTHHAKLLILDEPTSGLDPVFRNDFLELLEELVKKEKLSVLFSTHIISDLEKIADSITYIKDGKIEFSKDRDKLLEEYYYVKGPNTSLTAELKNRISNYKGNEFGFSGMIRKAEINDKEDFKEVIFEPPTIEDIILCIEKEEER